MKLLLTGAGGLLAREFSDLAPAAGHTLVALPRAELDVTDARAVHAALDRHRPDVVLNCAAYTAVDRAEANADAAFRVNRDGARYVAEAAAAYGAVMVHPGTDFVFDGRARRPYRPDDPLAPLGVYGRSKAEGERAVLDASSRHLVVRTSWLYGAGGRNFISAILERAERGLPLRVVSDQRGRPTWARNLAGTILELLAVRPPVSGIWHATDGGEATWLELAREALALRGLDADIEPVSTEAWGAPAPRPPYSVLDVSATEALLGRPMMPWRQALREFLDRLQAPPLRSADGDA